MNGLWLGLGVRYSLIIRFIITYNPHGRSREYVLEGALLGAKVRGQKPRAGGVELLGDQLGV